MTESTNPLKGEWHWLPTGIFVGIVVVLAFLAGDKIGGRLGAGAACSAFTAWIYPIKGEFLKGYLGERGSWYLGMFFGLIAGGIVGAYLTGTLKKQGVPYTWEKAFGPSKAKFTAVYFIGGFLLQVGASIARGCTSGNILSGWPQLSIGSFVSGMILFAVGIATANLLFLGKREQVVP